MKISSLKAVKCMYPKIIEDKNYKYAFEMFFTYLQELILVESSDNFAITKLSILLEGFYKYISELNLSPVLIKFRNKIWANHYGTPTLAFLISYSKEIKLTKEFFKKLIKEKKPTIGIKPWEIKLVTEFHYDDINRIYINVESISKVKMPPKNECEGQFIKTHNPYGGFTTTPSDSFSKKFIEISKQSKTLLEIGAAFGAATLQIVSSTSKVFCNDIDPNNLSVIRNRNLKNVTKKLISLTGDEENLIFIPGEFPHELEALPKEYFDAILISRVLHFFPGKKIEQSIRLIASILKPKGKIFLICETPFLKNWLHFLPEYEKRLKAGVEWPGEIDNPSQYEDSGRSKSLPPYVHWLTKEVIEKLIKDTNLFEIEEIAYIDRKGQFPKDLLLNGKESVGMIAVKK